MSRLDEDQRAGHCRQCGERLPLIKRVKREEFCSDEHRERYLSSTQTVALNRLREADNPRELDEEPVAIALEEEPAPPMAGTIGPVAVDAPMHLAALFADDATLVGQWEPVKPEPQWHHLALRFNLAPFSGDRPCDGTSALYRSPVAIHDGSAPEELALTLTLPRNGLSVIGSQPRAEGETPEAAAPEAEGVVPASPGPRDMPPRAVSPLPDALGLGATLLLPAFEAPEWLWLAGKEWALAGGSNPEVEALGCAIGLVTQGHETDPVFDGCVPVKPSSGYTPDAEAVPVIFDPEAIERSEGSFEDLADRLGQEAAPVAGGGDADCEEKGRSETVQSMAEGIGERALGTRIANPFLQEPQPWPGSGKPRWTPATASLDGSNQAATPERSMEDWDIL